MSDAAIRDRLEAIWQRHEPLVRDRIGVLRAAADDPSAERLAAAAGAAHKLAGSLGTLGRHDAGDAAAEAEALLAGPAPDLARLAALVRRIEVGIGAR